MLPVCIFEFMICVNFVCRNLSFDALLWPGTICRAVEGGSLDPQCDPADVYGRTCA
jgi:hypothetical protein